jgi:hypothetical protein
MSTKSPQLPKYQPPAGGMPPFITTDPNQIESSAVAMDQQAYGLSDADFRQRYPQLYNTQQTFLNNLNTQMSGGVNPQMQNVWATSGATNALRSTGNWSMGSGTSGMANIARNLGLDQMTYQNNLNTQFQQANDTFRPRTFGLSGADTAQMLLANTAGQNNWNQANFAYKVQEAQYAAGQGAQQAALNANAANATTSTAVGGASSVAALAVIAAFTCWVARESFGYYDPRWKRFRHWLLNSSPGILRYLYVRHGATWACWLSRKDYLKPAVRLLLSWCMRKETFTPCPFHG